MKSAITRYNKIIMPFTAIVGHENLKKALILTTINPRISGVLIRGPKGTAKSTIVRSLGQLLPDIDVVKDCSYNCHPYHRPRMCDECLQRLEMGEELMVLRRQAPVVNLPVSATEDRIVGGLDFEYALRTGKRRIEPGLLGRANRGIIYIDDINLLDDYLGNLLLDVWATGFNLIEREGISISHPAEFIVVGTMNPEEGDLRPQILDRFGLCVNVEPILDLRDRMEIIKRQCMFDEAPLSFTQKWSEEQASLRNAIIQGRERLYRTTIIPGLLEYISCICLENRVAGQRADLLIAETARTIAALEGRETVLLADIHEAAKLVLPHRSRQPLSDTEDSEGEQRERAIKGESSGKKVSKIEKQIPEDIRSDTEKSQPPGRERFIPTRGFPAPDSQPRWEEDGEATTRIVSQTYQEGENIPGSLGIGKPLQVKKALFKIGKPFKVKPIVLKRDRQIRRGSGRRSFSKTLKKSGRYIRSTAIRKNNDLAFDATIRAAAPYQQRRERNKVAISIETEDIREKVRERKIGNLLMFIVDASGSMGNRLMSETKGAIMSLLLDAYQKRDKVGFVAFRETRAFLLLPPTNSIELAQKLLEDLPTGGRTPLAQGLVTGYEVVMNYLCRDRNTSPLMILISDCQANVGLNESREESGDSSFRGYDYVLQEILHVAEQIHSERRINTLVIEITRDNKPYSLGKKIAKSLGARYSHIHDLKATGIVSAIKDLSLSQS